MLTTPPPNKREIHTLYRTSFWLFSFRSNQSAYLLNKQVLFRLLGVGSSFRRKPGDTLLNCYDFMWVYHGGRDRWWFSIQLFGLLPKIFLLASAELNCSFHDFVHITCTRLGRFGSSVSTIASLCFQRERFNTSDQLWLRRGGGRCSTHKMYIEWTPLKFIKCVEI